MVKTIATLTGRNSNDVKQAVCESRKKDLMFEYEQLIVSITGESPSAELMEELNELSMDDLFYKFEMDKLHYIQSYLY